MIGIKNHSFNRRLDTRQMCPGHLYEGTGIVSYPPPTKPHPYLCDPAWKKWHSLPGPVAARLLLYRHLQLRASRISKFFLHFTESVRFCPFPSTFVPFLMQVFLLIFSFCSTTSLFLQDDFQFFTSRASLGPVKTFSNFLSKSY